MKDGQAALDTITDTVLAYRKVKKAKSPRRKTAVKSKANAHSNGAAAKATPRP